MHNDQTQTPILPQECLSLLLENVSQGVLFLDEHGAVRYGNTRAEKILGVPLSKLLLNDFWAHFDDAYFGFSMREAIQGKILQNPRTLAVKSLSGEEYILKLTPLPNPEGLLLLISDETERNQLQMAAQRSNRLKELGGMAALLAHEIRNPLGGIKGFAGLLSRDLKESPELQHMANFIVEGTDNLSKLTTHVLNYAHPFQTHLERVPLADLIQDLIANLKADEALSKGIRFEFLTASRIIADADKQLLRSALLNLMVNGIQAMPEGGTLKVLLNQDDNHAVIRISDTGTGISPENLKKLFSAFFTTKPKGNGFGLLEVNKVMQAHHGTVDVESTVGQGTTFTIKLPLT